MGMRILVLGSGGREHAIVHALAASPLVDRIMAAPGNGGTAGERDTVNVALDINDGAAVAAFASDNACDLVVIGPEVPLVAGVADSVRAAGIPAFGPGASGARIEGSKAFSKELMERHGIPAARSRSFTAAEVLDAHALVDDWRAPIVIKADGLAAGKGVTVADDTGAAHAAIDECFAGRFGDAGAVVLVEEFLAGPECSLLAFVDGARLWPMAPAMDHKRVGDEDTGPNTGGMGVFSPIPGLALSDYGRMVQILQQTADALVAEGIEYCGVLYGGFVLTAEGPKVLEFNARFGDPETQVLLPRLETDLAEVLLGIAKSERTVAEELDWSRDACVSVVMASGGYPEYYETGKEISGLDDAAELPGVVVYHAGTERDDQGRVLTAGGRVLNVTAFAPEMHEAIRRAYDAVGCITFEGEYHRSDIGRKAL